MASPAWVKGSELLDRKYLDIHSGGSFAVVSETKLANENLKTVLNMLTQTEIPKVYINASSSFQTTEDFIDYIEYVNATLSANERKIISVYPMMPKQKKLHKDILIAAHNDVKTI